MGNGHNHYNFALRSSKPNAGVLTINDRAGDSLFDCNPGNGRLLSDEGRDTREMVVESNIRNNLTGVFMPGVEHELRTDLAASIACSLNERNQIYSSEVVWDMIQVNDSGLRGFRGCPSRASGMSGSRTGRRPCDGINRFDHHFFNYPLLEMEMIFTRDFSVGIFFDLFGVQGQVSTGSGAVEKPRVLGGRGSEGNELRLTQKSQGQAPILLCTHAFK